jgi:hypothetical protein
VHLHPEVLPVALLGLVHLRIPLPFLGLVHPAHSGFALVKVELGAAINVASTILAWRIAIPGALRMAVKRRMVGTSIRASSIAGSLREYHCCSRWMRSNRCAKAKGYVASGYGGLPPFLLVLG